MTKKIFTIVFVCLTIFGCCLSTINVSAAEEEQKIIAEDRYFYTDSQITEDVLISKIKVVDSKDANAKSKLKIMGLENVDQLEAGTYPITYSITNKVGDTYKKEVNIYVVDQLKDIEIPDYVRYISHEFLDTLGENSKWRTETELNQRLTATTNKEATDSNSIAIYKFDADTIKDIKEDIKTNGFGQAQNQIFNTKYASSKVK